MTACSRTLVLNGNWMPVNIMSVFEAIQKVYKERARFLDTETFVTYDFEEWVMNWDDATKLARVEEDKVISLPNLRLVLPEIIVCTEYKGMGYKIRKGRRPKFSRTNLYRRDKYTCQYCNKKFKSEDLTMDHVIPKSHGGEMVWENIALACIPCNGHKDNRTPQQAGMKLIREPHRPTSEEVAPAPMERLRRKVGQDAPKTWEQFLGKMYWEVELKD